LWAYVANNSLHQFWGAGKVKFSGETDEQKRRQAEDAELKF
jgi:hypothetical protein